MLIYKTESGIYECIWMNLYPDLANWQIGKKKISK